MAINTAIEPKNLLEDPAQEGTGSSTFEILRWLIATPWNCVVLTAAFGMLAVIAGAAVSIPTARDCFNDLYDTILDMVQVSYVGPKPEPTKALVKIADDTRTARAFSQDR